LVIDQIHPRHHIWRLHYREERYAHHLSQSELDRRIRDIVLNLLTVSAAGIGFRASEIPPDEIANPATIWLEEATHMLEEMELRHGPYPAGFTRDTIHKEPLPDFASELAAKAARRLASLAVDAGDVLIKYGKRQYMESLYNSGALRIQPATFFAETTHNEAIKDDELSITLSLVATREDLLTLVSNPRDVPPDLPNKRVDVVVQLESDHWLYCVSSSLSPRLFIDYGADACVIIRDRARFARMLQEANLQKLSGTRMCDGAVDYIDPLFPKSITTAVAFSKHFRYAYQHEHRFCWFPPHAISRVKRCDVEIGSLKEFGDLIAL
jgi:hypothetical protein